MSRFIHSKKQKRVQSQQSIPLQGEDLLSEQTLIHNPIEKNQNEMLNTSIMEGIVHDNQSVTTEHLTESQIGDIILDGKELVTDEVSKPIVETKQVISVQVESFKSFQEENELISKKMNKPTVTELEPKQKQEQFVQLSLDEFLSDALIINQHELEGSGSLGKFEQQIFDEVQTILSNHHRPLDNVKTKYVGGYFDIVGRRTMLRFKLKGRKKYILTHLSPEEVSAKNLLSVAPSKNEKYKTRIPIISLYVLEQLSDYILQRYDDVY